MARRKDKEKALKLRKKGYSYTMIKKELGVPKSTLSGWLRDYPLSEQRIRELRGKNPRRIERYRNTMRKKREAELERYLEKMKKEIGELSGRELFLAGLFLYWAEGWKTDKYKVAFSNTDWKMIYFFIKWLELLEVDRRKIRVYLHIYQDMDYGEILDFWSNILQIPKSQFTKPNIKSTNQKGLSYKTGHGKGTCNVIYHSKEIGYRVHMALKYIQDIYS